MHRHKKLNDSLLIDYLLIALVMIMGIFFYAGNLIKQSKNISFNKPLEKTFCSLANESNDCGQIQKLWPVALMIDNNPDAWPLAGLSQAEIVYNTLVEGGTTRLMAIFTSVADIKKIGPVRSARPYYVDWVKELNALYGHSGGSPEALQKIDDLDILDLNEISYLGPVYFYRDKNKLAPHNLFTDSKKINVARKNFELTDKTTEFVHWKFSNVPVRFLETANKIKVNYSAMDLFNTRYDYNTSTKTYLRFQNEKPFIDANDKTQIAVKNLVVQFVPEEIHLDAEDRLKIETVGQGAAWIFIEGKLMRGSWTKKSPSERTIFYDSNKQEIIFQPGNIWIEVVPGNRGVKME